MITPARIQLSRRKGFSLQAVSIALNGLPAVNCARPGKWGNPYSDVQGPGWQATDSPLPRDKFGVVCGGRPLAVHDTELAATRDAIQRYRSSLIAGRMCVSATYVIERLRGHNLACWCAIGSPCHVDTLLELARESA
jgi:hypothetical protein